MTSCRSTLAVCAQALREVAPDQAATILIERPKLAAHGDYACNLAMQQAKPLCRLPRDIAMALIAALMRSIKRTLDPQGLMNPGKVI